MSSPCTFLAWDSEFFGQRIARVEGNHLTDSLQNDVDSWCGANKIDCVYLLTDAAKVDTVRIAEQGGYHFVDIRMTLGCQTETASVLAERDRNVSIRVATAIDVPALIEMSKDQFVYSRFYQDECFSRERCHALYGTWVAESSRPSETDHVLVAELEQKPVGYLIISHHPEDGIGQFSLMAVDSELQGLGIGSLLVNQGIRIFQEQNVRELRMITQGRNISSQQLYQKFGLRTVQVQLWYHKWYSNCSDL